MFSLGKNLSNEFKIFYAFPKSKYFNNYLNHGNHLFIKERKIIFKDLINILKFVLNNDIDLLHAHGKGAGILSRIINIFVKKKIIYTYHGIHLTCHSFLKRNLYLIYELLTGNIDSAKVFVSLSEKNYAIDSGIYCGRKSTIINNGVKNKDLKIYKLKTHKVISNKSFKNIKVISICRFVEQKNVKEILEIAKILKDIEFQIIGDGPLFKEIVNLKNKYRLKNVNLLGRSNDIFRYLYDSDIYLSTSLYEGLPLSILEAMSIGLPIVASNVIGNCDTIQDSQSGFLYELNNTNEAAYYIYKLSNDQNLRIKTGRSAMKTQRSKFSLNNMIVNYEKLYKKVL